VQPSIATGHRATRRRQVLTPSSRPWRWLPAGLRNVLSLSDPTAIGLFFVIVALGLYTFSNPSRGNYYNHFVLQAQAYLNGSIAIPLPGFQDVMPLPDMPGYGLLPFPPLPALVELPFVIVWGTATNQGLIAVVLGAINVGLCWRMLTRVTENSSANFLATLFFGFGTVAWYASMLGSTWFFAHVVATTFLLLAITAALDGERMERVRDTLRRAGGRVFSRDLLDPVQFLAGFIFGIAALARLTVIFGAPFFVFVGGGGSYWRRALSAGLGALLPVLALVAYNLASTGHVFNPAYDWLYHHEYLGYMPAGLQINTSLGIEDIGHIPLNLLVMLGWPPQFDPGCGLALLNPPPHCALLRPDTIGMSALLTSPAYLLAVPMVAAGWRQRLVMGSALAVLAIATVNLMHFSQGWVQFGYRFSNDFAPFAVVLVGLAIAWLGTRWWVVALVIASIVVNAWGVYWGVVLGW
jgi:hypothetical protein